MKKRLSLGRLKLESDSRKLMNIVLNAASSHNVVVFRLGEDIWAFSIDILAQTLRAQKFKFYNESSDISILKGYILLNGKAVPVLTIHKIFEAEAPKEIDSRSAILLCKTDDFSFGLLTDEVLEIMPIDEKTYRPIPVGFLAKYKNIITGAHPWREKILITIDLQNILNKTDLSILSEEGMKIITEEERK